MKRLARHFDAELGWTAPYGTPFGERPRAVDYGRPLVSAFGDSFTHGDEVGDRQTWAEALAASLGGDVFNSGSAATAWTRRCSVSSATSRDGRRRSSIFAFISGDLERCNRRYWKFHSPRAPFPMTKPRLVLRDGALELLPNPVRTPEALQRRRAGRRLRRAPGTRRPVVQPDGLPAIRRPHLLHARPAVRVARRAHRGQAAQHLVGPRRRPARRADPRALRAGRPRAGRAAGDRAAAAPRRDGQVPRARQGAARERRDTRASASATASNASSRCSTRRPDRWASAGAISCAARGGPLLGTRQSLESPTCCNNEQCMAHHDPPVSCPDTQEPGRSGRAAMPRHPRTARAFYKLIGASRRARLCHCARPAIHEPAKTRPRPRRIRRGRSRARSRAISRCCAAKRARPGPGARRSAPAALADLDRRRARRARARRARRRGACSTRPPEVTLVTVAWRDVGAPPVLLSASGYLEGAPPDHREQQGAGQDRRDGGRPRTSASRRAT